MSAYHYNSDIHHRLKRWRKVHRSLMVVLILFSFALVGGGVYVWQQSTGNSPPAVTKELGAYYSNPQRAYNNELFSFRSSKEWQFSPTASTLGSKYVYTNQSNGLIRHELRIYLDGSLSGTPVNYIVPVSVQSGKIMAENPSPRCGEGIPDVKRTSQGILQEYQGIKFTCELLLSKESMAAGIAGGGYNIPLYSPNGRLKQVNFLFIDHSDQYYADTFREILSSFSLK